MDEKVDKAVIIPLNKLLNKVTYYKKDKLVRAEIFIPKDIASDHQNNSVICSCFL